MTAFHVVPVDDLIEHNTDTDEEPVPRDDGSMGWLIVHASLDGRELTEAR